MIAITFILSFFSSSFEIDLLLDLDYWWCCDIKAGTFFFFNSSESFLFISISCFLNSSLFFVNFYSFAFCYFKLTVGFEYNCFCSTLLSNGIFWIYYYSDCLISRLDLFINLLFEIFNGRILSVLKLENSPASKE